jgi:hypothetical protein
MSGIDLLQTSKDKAARRWRSALIDEMGNSSPCIFDTLSKNHILDIVSNTLANEFGEKN